MKRHRQVRHRSAFTAAEGNRFGIRRPARHELLSSAIFDALAEARYLIDRSRPFYDCWRIRGELAKMTPAACAATGPVLPPHPARCARLRSGTAGHARDDLHKPSLAGGRRQLRRQRHAPDT